MNKFEIDSEYSNQDVAFHHIYEDYPELHTHDYWEFFVVLEGSYKHKINGKSMIMHKNQAFLIRPLDCHALYNNDKVCGHINILIREEFLKKICDMYSDSIYNLLLSHDIFFVSLNDLQTQKIVDYTSYLKENVSTDIDKKLIESLLVSYILEKAISQNDILKSNKPKWLQDILLQINSPYNINWNVDDVLSISNYSHTHFARLFKQYMNCTLIQYLTKVKMSSAEDFLLHSNTSILDISEALGYSSLSHFNHVFKGYFNMSPTQYKKANKH